MGKVKMLVSILYDLKNGTTGPCYGRGDRKDFNACVEKYMANILKFRGNNKFLVGDEPTYVDFWFWENVQLMAMVTDDKIFQDYPSLKDYCDNVRHLPKLKEYFDDESCS